MDAGGIGERIGGNNRHQNPHSPTESSGANLFDAALSILSELRGGIFFSALRSERRERSEDSRYSPVINDKGG
jgi:hypothetical protein